MNTAHPFKDSQPLSRPTLVPSQTHPTHPWHRVWLALIVLLSACMNTYGLQQNGYGNIYYAAAMKSMTFNWHNFFFVSFDPGGFVTVDKPPLGLWIEAIAVKLLGFSSWSLLLPQAIAGVLCVSCLVLALTPIMVVGSRENLVDVFLVLVVLLGAWTVSKAAETGRLRWLLLTAVLLGLGFSIKALQAYLVVPAFGLMYLLGAPRPWLTRMAHLALALVLLLIISLCWLVAVDLTPASQRPYVGSSQDNSEISLALGYNGIDRLVGLFGSGSHSDANVPQNTAQSLNPGRENNGQSMPQFPGGSQDSMPSFSGSGMLDNSPPSPIRLLTGRLGDQASWFLLFAICTLLTLAWQRPFRLPLDRAQQSLVLWGIWLITMFIFFSIAGFYHEYYLVMLAPAISALTGIGLVTMWNEYRQHKKRGLMLPIALLLTALGQVVLLTLLQFSSPAWIHTLALVVCVIVVLVAAALLIAYRKSNLDFLQLPSLAVATLALLITPSMLVIFSIINPINGALPAASFPISSASNASFASVMNGGSDLSTQADQKLVNYLIAQQGRTRYLVATINAFSAAPLIIATDKPVMAIGGFLGSDPILTQEQFEQMVKDNTLRFFLVSGPSSSNGALSQQLLHEVPPQMQGMVEEMLKHGGPSGMGESLMGGTNTKITDWVTNHCKAVPENEWRSSGTQSSGDPLSMMGSEKLYDCMGAVR